MFLAERAKMDLDKNTALVAACFWLHVYHMTSRLIMPTFKVVHTINATDSYLKIQV